jgi:hypothetical protein
MEIKLPIQNHFFSSNAVIVSFAIFINMTIPCCLCAGETMLHRFDAKEQDSQLEEVLYLDAGVALSQAGFSSTRKEGSPDYILLTEYAYADNKVKIRYTLFRPNAPGHELAAADYDLAIDYDLDEQITNAVQQVLKMADIKGAPSKKAEIEGLMSGQAGLEDKDAGHPGASDNEVRAGTKPKEGFGKPQSAIFDSSASAGGVMFLGDVTGYFHYAAAGLLAVGFMWPQDSWTVALRARLSFINVFNDAGVSGGPLYFSTCGLNLQIGTAADMPYRADVGVSGGATAITVAGAHIMTKTVPYADAGAHASVPIIEHLFVGGEVRFFAIFDTGLLIMGVTPALTLSLEV